VFVCCRWPHTYTIEETKEKERKIEGAQITKERRERGGEAKESVEEKRESERWSERQKRHKIR